jgi:phosphoserine phosphatase
MTDEIITSQDFSIVIFDLDGVLVDSISSWVYLHDHFGVNNDPAYYAYMRNEIDDYEFMRRDIKLWLNKTQKFHISELTQILDSVPYMPGFFETMKVLNNNNIQTAIVSAGLEQLANRVAEAGNIRYVFANGLETDEVGYLTGEGILRVELRNKGKVVRNLLEELNIESDSAISIGNGEIDITMFEESGFSIAFDPADNKIRESADIIIEKKDLTEILNYII